MKWFWSPSTEDNGKEYSEEDVIENSSLYLHVGTYKFCAIYFLIDCDEVVYIGQTLDVKTRLKQHSVGDKIFNRFFFVRCEKEELNKLEAYYILKFRPKYNIAIPKVANETN